MKPDTFDVVLEGCRPEPLASYLKALAVLRLVGEQKDKEARGFWQGEHFVVRSSLDRNGLLAFFVGEWRPTPVIAPWSGGSGFFPKDATEAADAIVSSGEQRLALFASVIQMARAYVQEKGWTERPEAEDKFLCLSEMRSRLPDEALAWLDAAVLVGDDRLLFPPLLGTGGNDGRLDFSNNFQQRVVEVLSRDSADWCRSSLFGTTTSIRFKGAMGQYQPAASERTNPWDFVLLIEGALMFAASASRRNENAPATMAFPFHARAAGGSVTVTDSDEDESRDELWLPLWPAPSSLREIRRLFSEGRAKVGTGDTARPASSALDFARAVNALGVDRGISGFERIGFHVRNGLAYFATPLGRFSTGEVQSARLLDEIDRWYDRFRQKASGKNVPARISVAKRRLELAMFESARLGSSGPVLRALGAAEQALGQSLSFSTKQFLRPVPPLSSAWASSVDDGSVEQRLAAALASRPRIRARIIPLHENRREFGRESDQGFVFRDRALVENLHALLLREDVEATQRNAALPSEPNEARCSLDDLASFVDGEVDDDLIEQWLRGLVLIDGGLRPTLPQPRRFPPASFAVLALVHNRYLGGAKINRTPGALARACSGDVEGATALAIRRLNASGRPVPIRSIVEPSSRARRIAAALAFPLSKTQRHELESVVLPAPDVAKDPTGAARSSLEDA